MAGGWPSSAYARSAWRTCPMTAAARSAVPRDVPDRHDDRAVAERGGVVEIPADLQRASCGHIAAGELGADHVGQRMGQEAPLQRQRDFGQLSGALALTGGECVAQARHLEVAHAPEPPAREPRTA